MKIVILGTSWPYRSGGIASFNEQLARTLQAMGHGVKIHNFLLQYPGFLFPGTTQYSQEPAPTDLHMERTVHALNPWNWWQTGKKIAKEKPDLVLVRYWIPFLGPALGTILRVIKKKQATRIVCIADNVVPHEKRPGDEWFTRYFVQPIDAFVTLSQSVAHDLTRFSAKPVLSLPHPLYEQFGQIADANSARQALNLPLTGPLWLFFGFIRRYKGLDLLLPAFQQALKQIPPDQVKPQLVIAGEWYEGQEEITQLAQALDLGKAIHWHTHFIPPNAVANYFNACDLVIQPYREATQSGVTPLAYHFEKPVLVTRVGALPEMIEADHSGFVAEPNAADLAQKLLLALSTPAAVLQANIRAAKEKYSWESFCRSIVSLATEN